MSVVELRPQPTLDELAETINREHDLTVTSLLTAVEHAIRAGEALLEARQFVAFGGWLNWVEENTSVSRKSVHFYTRLATYKEAVGSARTLREAKSLMVGLPELRDRDTTWLPMARELRAQGATQREIADIVGVSPSAVCIGLNPGKNRLYNRRAAERQKQARAAKKALERQHLESQMRAAGGDAWDAYLLTRKLAALLDKLGASAEYAKCVAIEDALVKRVKGA